MTLFATKNREEYTTGKVLFSYGKQKVDISNKEQLVLCIRWVDEDLQVQEDFIGIHKTPNTTANESC